MNERGEPRALVLKPAGDEPEGDGRRWKAMEEEKRWRVETVGEVWRVDDEWWRQAISRRYVEVILEGGKHMVLFEDLTTNQWWMQMP